MHMLSVIKTAIITIIISFISGVLLDSYKNFAPRILCTMGKPIPLKLSGKKIRAFTLIIRNISNKTIHDLSLNIQGHYDNLKIDDAKITKGLKFETSSESNSYNISIPFLSKNDEFSVKLFVESCEGVIKKPIITLRSPEDFKRVDSLGKNGYIATIAGIPKDISDSITKRKNKKQKTDSDNRRVHSKEQGFFKHKKVLIAIAGILLIIYAGILGDEYYEKVAGKMATSNEKVNTQEMNASFGKSSIAPDNTSSNTGSTSSTSSTSKSKSSNDNTVSSDKPDTASTKSAIDTSKDTSEKSASPVKSKNTKSSSNSEAKTSSTASAENEVTDDSSNKNSEADNNKADTTGNSDTQSGSSNKNQPSLKARSIKSTEQNSSEAPKDQGTTKAKSNSTSNQEPTSSISEAGNN